MPKFAILTVAELAKIDQLSYEKANRILGEAQTRLQCFDYDLAVRRSQEAFDLYLKGVFRFLQAEYPTVHDVKKEIYALTTAFRQHQLEPQIQTRQVARLVLANSVLQLWRLPAFYGDARLNVGGLFEESEAKLALSYADSAQFVCSVVRFHYQLAATAQTQK
jgi:HEPN domain-containing protein